MNALAAELALRFESARVAVLLERLSGTLIFHCDALSCSAAQGAVVPPMMRGVRRCFPRPREASFFCSWPRGPSKA
eukprot:11196045-Lingulodinium_polyedra.AAC.1